MKRFLSIFSILVIAVVILAAFLITHPVEASTDFCATWDAEVPVSYANIPDPAIWSTEMQTYPGKFMIQSWVIDSVSDWQHFYGDAPAPEGFPGINWYIIGRVRVPGGLKSYSFSPLACRDNWPDGRFNGLTYGLISRPGVTWLPTTLSFKWEIPAQDPNLVAVNNMPAVWDQNGNIWFPPQLGE